MKRVTAILLLSAAVISLIGLAYLNRRPETTTQVFSPYSVLTSSWEMYKKDFINDDGRVIDYSQNEMTTSEGQSYAMLRAVWIDDKKTFDTVWNWTQVNLQHEDDALFGWRWGKLEDGSYGLLGDGGQNSATDADSDIALALIFASEKWGDQRYADAARPILSAIWDLETEAVNDQRYLLSGTWATNATEIVLNPSYFAPYAWRIFAQFDPERDWLSLIEPAYRILHESGQVTLNDRTGVGLPPNWITLDKATGSLRAAFQDENSSRYSFDAMRVPWRIAVDYAWFGDERALEYLKSLGKLAELYRRYGILTGSYEHDGTPVTEYESPAMYATAMGYFKVVEPERAKALYENKLVVLYSNDTNTFKAPLNYYDQNWLWFSLALYHDQLPDLYTTNGGSAS